MRARLIVNPTAGSDRAPVLLPLINERLRTLAADLDITLTTCEADIASAARRAVDERRDVLFVAGGDGTVNVAVRAVAAMPGGLERIAFGIVPLGTGNDFAKALDLGEDAERALDALVGARTIEVDLGLLNDRPFFNTSAGGFIADVSASMTEELKDAAGKIAYLIGGARALFGRDPFAATVGLPEGGASPWPEALDLQLFAVCNARFIGGGYPIAPHAVLDDGLLDVFLVKRLPLLEFVAVLQSVAAGEHAQDSRVVHFRTSALDLDFDRLVHVNTDGEVLEAGGCRYRVLPRAARFLCGVAPHAARAPEPLMV